MHLPQRKHVLAADAVEMEESGGVGLTSVVANAGVASGAVSTAGQSGASTAAPIMNVNLMGTLNTVTPVIPLFAERRRGQIVIVSSVAAFFPGMPMFTSYGASKAAQRHYGECLRIGLEAYGVDVLTVCPSFVQTRMTAGLEGKVPMVSAQRAVSQIADAMCHRTCGTLFVPRKASILTAVYSSLPMHFRALVCRLAGRRAGVDYLASPN
jgi:NAD(P)-dependent dehydrogenase (short-subunit alcohol dehydrogenase family)